MVARRAGLPSKVKRSALDVHERSPVYVLGMARDREAKQVFSLRLRAEDVDLLDEVVRAFPLARRPDVAREALARGLRLILCERAEAAGARRPSRSKGAAR